MFGLKRFKLEVLLQVYLAEILGHPIKEGHGWITARGNSICAIVDELIPRKLVEKFNGGFITSDDGKEMATLILQEIVEASQAQSRQIDKQICELDIKRVSLPVGSQQRLLIILEIHQLKQEKDKIISELGQFQQTRIDSYGQTQKI